MQVTRGSIGTTMLRVQARRHECPVAKRIGHSVCAWVSRYIHVSQQNHNIQTGCRPTDQSHSQTAGFVSTIKAKLPKHRLT
jgi:hypothetical protein